MNNQLLSALGRIVRDVLRTGVREALRERRAGDPAGPCGRGANAGDTGSTAGRAAMAVLNKDQGEGNAGRRMVLLTR